MEIHFVEIKAEKSKMEAPYTIMSLSEGSGANQRCGARIGIRFRWILMALALSLVAPDAYSDMEGVGVLSFNLVNPAGSSGPTYDFLIINLTGANADPVDGFPVSTPLDFQDLGLTVNFTDGSSHSYALSDTGAGLDLTTDSLWTDNVGSAVLTGNFSPLNVTLAGGGASELEAAFSTTLIPSSGSLLQDADVAIIEATTTATTVPEAPSWTFLAAILAGLLWSRSAFLRGWHSSGLTRMGAIPRGGR